ncbi:hypothetical protein ACQJBY_026008 [Aegilops geniculata]
MRRKGLLPEESSTGGGGRLFLMNTRYLELNLHVFVSVVLSPPVIFLIDSPPHALKLLPFFFHSASATSFLILSPPHAMPMDSLPFSSDPASANVTFVSLGLGLGLVAFTSLGLGFGLVAFASLGLGLGLVAFFLIVIFDADIAFFFIGVLDGAAAPIAILQLGLHERNKRRIQLSNLNPLLTTSER